MNRLQMTVSVFALMITVAPAQAFDHKRTEFSLGYNSLSASSENFDGPFIAAKTDFGFSPTYGLQVNATYEKMSFASTDMNKATIGLHPYYEFGSGNRLGAFFQQTHYSFTSAPNTFNLQYAGIEGIVNPLSSVSLEGYAGVGRIDDGSDNRITTIGGEVRYGLSDTIAAHFSVDYDMLDTGSNTITFSQFAIGADYYLGNIGSAFPMTLSAEIGQMGFGGSTADQASIVITIPLGGGNDTSSRKLFGDRGGPLRNFGGFL